MAMRGNHKLIVRKENEEDRRVPLRGNTVDFRHLRVREEINIQGEKIKLLEGWELFVRDHRNEKG